MKENYGKEALELAQEISYKFRQEQTLERTTLSIFKYALNIVERQTFTLPTFMGQANTYAHLEVGYSLPDGITGTVVTYINDRKVFSCELSQKISLDLLVSSVNTISFDVIASAPTIVTDLALTITGEIKKPSLSHDILAIDDFGFNVYQPMLQNKTYLYTFQSIDDMTSVNSATPSGTKSYFCDYCYKYNTDKAKTGRVEVKGNNLSINDLTADTTITSDVANVQTACISPLFNENYNYIVYYVKDDKLYYAKVANVFETGVEMPVPFKYGIKKLVSLKRMDDKTTHLPHFCFIDKKDDAYIVVCNSDGSYANPQKLGKAEGLSIYQKGAEVVVFLFYQETVVKIAGAISTQSGRNVFTPSSKVKVTNVDSAGMSSSGAIYYKSRNVIYEESNS